MVTNSNDERPDPQNVNPVAEAADGLQLVHRPGPADVWPPAPTHRTAGRIIDLRDRPDDAFSPHLDPYLAGRRLTGPDELLAARRLLTQVYLAMGYISADDVTDAGTLSDAQDPWVSRSSYFGATRDDQIQATVRQISPESVDELPALRLSGLDPELAAPILALAPDEVVEISALARRPKTSSIVDVVAVYSRMFLESLALGHRAWVMGVDLRVFEQLRNVITGESIHAIGERQEYLGSTVVPAVIWLAEMTVEMRRRAAGEGDVVNLTTILPQLFPHPGPPPGATIDLTLDVEVTDA